VDTQEKDKSCVDNQEKDKSCVDTREKDKSCVDTQEKDKPCVDTKEKDKSLTLCSARSPFTVHPTFFQFLQNNQYCSLLLLREQ
jgi:hypothetical protein